MSDTSPGRRSQSVRSETFTRRRLPHWQLPGVTYFLTWRCADGVTLTEAERGVVLSAVRHWDAIRWDVLAAVVMPDHVHVLACPLAKGDGRWDIGELLHSVKSFSAHLIAKQRTGRRDAGPTGGMVGPASRRSPVIWQDERYDRWMRDEDEIAEKWDYIAGNPVRAGLVEKAEEYAWLHQKAGGTPAPPIPPIR